MRLCAVISLAPTSSHGSQRSNVRKEGRGQKRREKRRERIAEKSAHTHSILMTRRMRGRRVICDCSPAAATDSLSLRSALIQRPQANASTVEWPLHCSRSPALACVLQPDSTAPRRRHLPSAVTCRSVAAVRLSAAPLPVRHLTSAVPFISSSLTRSATPLTLFAGDSSLSLPPSPFFCNKSSCCYVSHAS